MMHSKKTNYILALNKQYIAKVFDCFRISLYCIIPYPADSSTCFDLIKESSEPNRDHQYRHAAEGILCLVIVPWPGLPDAIRKFS